MIVMNDGTGAELIEVEDSEDLVEVDISKTVFSAIVTARKPPN